MLEKWYCNSKNPVFIFFAITLLLLYFGRQFNCTESNSGKKLCCTVEVSYPGMAGNFLEEEITVPLEKQLSALDKISEIRSVSQDSKVSINLYFENDADKKAVYCNLSGIIDDFYGTCSHPIQRPTIYFSDSNSAPDFLYAIYRESSDKNMENKIKNEIVPVIEGVDGVSRVLLSGNETKELVAIFDNEKIAPKNLSSNDLASAIQKTNPLNSSVELKTGFEKEKLKVKTTFSELSQLKDLQIKLNGQYLRFNDLAILAFEKKETDEIVKLNGKECLEIEVWASNRTSKIFLSKKIQDILCKGKLSGKYIVLQDSGKNQLENLKKVTFALLQSLALVLVCIPLFFYGEQLSVSILLFLTTSLVWTMLILSALKIEISHFIIAGISISLGIIIDPILVISELRTGNTNDKFLRELHAIIPSLVSSTGTNLIVFIPFLGAENLVPGIRALVASMAIMTVVSFLIALFYYPWILLRSKRKSAKQKITLPLKIFQLNAKAAAITYGALILISFILIVLFEKDSSMHVESSIISASLEYNPEKKKEYIDDRVIKIIEEIKKEKGIEDILSTARKGNCQLSIKYEKKILKDKDIKNITSKLKALATEGYMFVHDGNNLEKGSYCIEVAIEGQEPKECRRIAETAVGKIKGIHEVEDAVLHFKSPEKVMELIPKNDFLRFYNSSPMAFAEKLYWSVSSPVIDKYTKNGTEYDVKIRGQDAKTLTKENLLDKKILLGENTYKVKECATAMYSEDIGNLYRKNNRCCAYLSVYVKSSDVKKVKGKVQKLFNEMEIGECNTYSLDRQTRDFEENYKSIASYFIVSVLLLFILLCGLNERPLSSLLIISIIPASFAFPLIIKFFSDTCLGMGDFIGMALSAGIVVNNAILIASSGLQKNCRSILITNITTILGAIPVLVSGASGYIKDLSFHMLFSSIAALVLSFLVFPAIVKGNARITIKSMTS